MNRRSKIIIVVIVTLVLIIGAIIFIVQINKPKVEVPQIITQIKTSSENLANLVKENETLLSTIEEQYKKIKSRKRWIQR